jgi:hypothetical protein
MSVTGVTRYGERLHILPPAGATRAQGWFLLSFALRVACSKTIQLIVVPAIS